MLYTYYYDALENRLKATELKNKKLASENTELISAHSDMAPKVAALETSQNNAYELLLDYYKFIDELHDFLDMGSPFAKDLATEGSLDEDKFYSKLNAAKNLEDIFSLSTNSVTAEEYGHVLYTKMTTVGIVDFFQKLAKFDKAIDASLAIDHLIGELSILEHDGELTTNQLNNYVDALLAYIDTGNSSHRENKLIYDFIDKLSIHSLLK